MRVIIDTNVVVSAVLKDRDPEKVILFAVGHPEVEWVASTEILHEYRDVLARKRFGLPQDVLERWFALFDRVATLVEPETAFPFPRDPKDAPFLACTVAADADFLVTGDRDFVEARKVSVQLSALSGQPAVFSGTCANPPHVRWWHRSSQPRVFAEC